jgi:MtN3 and saliva related transmembrane protein
VDFEAPMDIALIVGYVASVCSMTSFVPQAWKIVKTGDTEAISTRMYAVTVVGFALWSVFGIMRMEWPIILTNVVCFCLSAFILVMKILPREKREKVAATMDPEKN